MSLPEQYRYIAVEGPIGVGKTSLARRLAAHVGAELLLENADENPFLARFYEDRKRYALPAQLFFLISRTDQVANLAQAGLFSPVTVADFLVEKDSLFARANLDDAEYALYRKLHADLNPKAPVPDLVIFLQAPLQTLMDRIRRRARSYEKTLPESYLRDLSRLYNDFFYHYDAAPVLMVNSEHLNFAERDTDFQLLVERIQAMRGPREFFNFSQ